MHDRLLVAVRHLSSGAASVGDDGPFCVTVNGCGPKPAMAAASTTALVVAGPNTGRSVSKALRPQAVQVREQSAEAARRAAAVREHLAEAAALEASGEVWAAAGCFRKALALEPSAALALELGRALRGGVVRLEFRVDCLHELEVLRRRRREHALAEMSVSF